MIRMCIQRRKKPHVMILKALAHPEIQDQYLTPQDPDLNPQDLDQNHQVVFQQMPVQNMVGLPPLDRDLDQEAAQLEDLSPEAVLMCTPDPELKVVDIQHQGVKENDQQLLVSL